MLEIKPLVAETTLSMEGRGTSPKLRVKLYGESLVKLGECLEKYADGFADAALQSAEGDPIEALEEITSKALKGYREIIDTACGEGASGKVIKWLADGDRIDDAALAPRLGTVVEWIAQRYSEAFDGLS